MSATAVGLEHEAIQKKYLERVKRFFDQVKSWLPNELEAVELPGRTIQDTTGKYAVGMMRIHKKGMPEPDNVIADIAPIGATTLLGEGLLEIRGPLGEEKLIYFCRKSLQQVEYQPGKILPIYRGVTSDAWYWLESSMSNRALRVTNKRFSDLVRLVSFYACE